MAVRDANWYDYPAYYDLAFQSETVLEADFFEAAFKKYCPFKVDRVLEPACGTGRLIAEMASRGYRVLGFDLSEPSLDFCRRRLKRRKLRGELFTADMAKFSFPTGKDEGRIDAAYNTFDSFRHLLTEESAKSHLRHVARCIRPQGIYILGFHLLPLDASEECIERWTERSSRTQVTVTLRVLATDRKKRLETIRISLLARDRGEIIRLRDEFRFRMYTAAQFRRLLKQTPEWELCDVYDFWYEIDRPLKFDNEISDTVFVLRRR